MDINELKSELILQNLYFEKIEFSREADIEEGTFDVDIKRTIKKENEIYKVSMPIEISKSDCKLKIVAVGVFQFTSEIDDEASRDAMMKVNAASIMFPFIRSQVAQVTAQPGMTPIILPAINVTKLLD